jgi:hypothetical protein
MTMRSRPAVIAMIVTLCLLGAGRALAAEAQPGAAAQPGVAEGLLRFAPPGTWGVVSFDASAILVSPAFKDVHLQASPDSTVPDFYSISAGAVFLLPAKLPLAGMPPWCAVLMLKAGARPAIEARLASVQQREEVEGLRAYVSSRAALVFADDNTFLFAPDAKALAALVRAWRAGAEGALDQRLRDALAPVRKDVAFAAVAPTGSVADLLGPEGVKTTSPFLLGATGASAGLTLGDKVSLTVTFRLASPEDAQKASDAANGQLTAIRQRLHGVLTQADEPRRPFIETMLLVYDNISPSVEGADLHLALALNPADVPKVTQAVMAAVMGARAAAAAAARGSAAARPAQGAPGPSPAAGVETPPQDQRSASESNLHNIGLTIIIYRAAHENQFPADLETLLTEGLFKENEVGVFVDPGDKQPARAGKRGLNYSYEYAGALPAATSRDVIICYSRKGLYPDERLVLRADGSVAAVSEKDLHDPKGGARTSLAAGYALAVAAFQGAVSDEQRAALKKFYEIEG